MKIIYNPSDGAPITSFIYKGERKEPHYPDGYKSPDGKVSNGLLQYDDLVADELLETYQFLQSLDIDEAKKILDRPEPPQYECDFPNCNFRTDTPIALTGHKRKHAKDIALAGTPLIDPIAIPVAGGSKINPLAESLNMEDNVEEKATRNGVDKDGVEWYGEGTKIENPGFGAVRQSGRGHFVG